MENSKVYDLILNLHGDVKTACQKVDELYSKVDSIDERLQAMELNYGQRISRVEQMHSDNAKMNTSRIEIWLLLFTLANLILMLWGR